MISTASHELRRLLDERGVEWKQSYRVLPGSRDVQAQTLWGQPCDQNGKPLKHVYHNRATEMGDDRLLLEAQLVLPIQAVEATLGRGTCTNVHEQPRDGTFWPVPHFKCSECGETHVSMSYVHYCPSCGRRVAPAV